MTQTISSVPLLDLREHLREVVLRELLEVAAQEVVHRHAARRQRGDGRARRGRALDTARGELDEKKRAAVYKQIDRIIMEEDAAFFPICNDLNLVVLSPKVKGFVNPPEEWFQLWTPWVEA